MTLNLTVKSQSESKSSDRNSLSKPEPNIVATNEIQISSESNTYSIDNIDKNHIIDESETVSESELSAPDSSVTTHSVAAASTTDSKSTCGSSSKECTTAESNNINNYGSMGNSNTVSSIKQNLISKVSTVIDNSLDKEIEFQSSLVLDQTVSEMHPLTGHSAGNEDDRISLKNNAAPVGVLDHDSVRIDIEDPGGFDNIKDSTMNKNIGAKSSSTNISNTNRTDVNNTTVASANNTDSSQSKDSDSSCLSSFRPPALLVALISVVLFTANSELLQSLGKVLKVSHLVSLFCCHIGGLIFMPLLPEFSWIFTKKGREEHRAREKEKRKREKNNNLYNKNSTNSTNLNIKQIDSVNKASTTAGIDNTIVGAASIERCTSAESLPGTSSNYTDNLNVNDGITNSSTLITSKKGLLHIPLFWCHAAFLTFVLMGYSWFFVAAMDLVSASTVIAIFQLNIVLCYLFEVIVFGGWWAYFVRSTKERGFKISTMAIRGSISRMSLSSVNRNSSSNLTANQSTPIISDMQGSTNSGNQIDNRNTVVTNTVVTDGSRRRPRSSGYETVDGSPQASGYGQRGETAASNIDSTNQNPSVNTLNSNVSLDYMVTQQLNSMQKKGVLKIHKLVGSISCVIGALLIADQQDNQSLFFSKQGSDGLRRGIFLSFCAVVGTVFYQCYLTVVMPLYRAPNPLLFCLSLAFAVSICHIILVPPAIALADVLNWEKLEFPDTPTTWMWQAISGVIASTVNSSWFYVLGPGSEGSSSSTANDGGEKSKSDTNLTSSDADHAANVNTNETAAGEIESNDRSRLTEVRNSAVTSLSGQGSASGSSNTNSGPANDMNSNTNLNSESIPNTSSSDNSNSNSNKDSVNPSLLGITMALSIPLSVIMDYIFHSQVPSVGVFIGQIIVLASFIVYHLGGLRKNSDKKSGTNKPEGNLNTT